MEHFYTSIHGWLSYANLYTEIVNKFSSGSKFVEIGSWLGRSASFMAVEIINSQKNIDFSCVDIWQYPAEGYDNFKQINSDMYELFLHNTKPVEAYIKPIKLASVEAATNFEDNSLDFIFIDAAHDYDNVKADIQAWYPKLKPTGVFAGHDYTKHWPGVVQAINEFVQINNLKLTTNAQEKKKHGKPLNPGCWIVYDNTAKH